MKRHLLIAASLIAALWLAASPARAGLITKDQVPGVTNFARLGTTTVGISGAITVEAVSKIKEMGFASIINLREASEPGANLEAEAAAAKAAGIRYISIPLNDAAPDPEAIDRFLDEITSQENQPALIHCARGHMAATTWFIKRLVVDQWDEPRAEEEATDLGMDSPALKQAAIDYVEELERLAVDNSC